MGKIILVTGAARSGKSEWAEHLARQSEKNITYIATATENPDDPEWTARIQRHRDRRPKDWNFVVESKDLIKVLSLLDTDQCVLIDSLGLWVASHLDKNTGQWDVLTKQLLTALPSLSLITIFVAEEAGWGVVPAYELGRLFRDRLGHLIRQIGAIATAVYLTTGGHALNLKQFGEVLPASIEPTN